MKTKALAVAALACVSAHSQLLIDDFSDGDFSISGNTVFESHTGTMLGGERRVAIWPGGGMSASVSDGVLTVDKPSSGAVLLIRYGNFTASHGGGQESGTPLNIDVSENLGFSASASSATGPFDLHFDLEGSNGGHTTATVHFDGPGTSSALFNTGGDANLNNIVGIEVMFPQTSATLGTLSMDSISLTPTPVPEPSFYASCFAGGLLVFGLIKKRFA